MTGSIMTPYPRFGGEDARPCSYAEARVAILPVPYEGTVSYGRGTAGGPRAILTASAQLEMYDEELDWCIDEAGLFTLPPVAVCEGEAPEAIMRRIHGCALKPLGDGKLLAVLGGAHSISYGVFTALQATRKSPFSLLQIDAHADLRPSYQGTAHSHACIMARAHELGLPFVQVGIRSLSAQERDFLRDTGLEANVFWARQILRAEDDGWMEEVVSRLEGDVYITVDIDALDPGIVPATGTPEPGGLDWYTTLGLLRRVAERRRVIGFDLTELAPIAGLHAPDYTAARLVYKLMGYALRGE